LFQSKDEGQQGKREAEEKGPSSNVPSKQLCSAKKNVVGKGRKMTRNKGLTRSHKTALKKLGGLNRPIP